MDKPEIKPATSPRRGAKAFLAGSTVAQLCALARYALLARFLGPQELGLVAMITLTSQFFQSISDNGGDRFLIQDKDGDAPEAQKLVQAMFVGRGVLQAVCLLVFAGPIAAYFKAPDLRLALMALALAPLISGFIHLDMRRSQRHHDYRSEGRTTLAAESLSLLATGLAAYFTRDFTAILYGLTVRSIVIVVASHWMAERPYGLGLGKPHATRLAKFAWPLMINGLLLFVGSQGDRVVVANNLGITQLGHYTAVLMLVFYPASLIMRYMGSMHLPRIAAARDDRAQRDAASDTMGSQTLLLGLGMSAGFALVGPIAITILYGPKYAQAASLVAFVGIFQSARFMRQWPTTVAIGMGKSGIVLTNNIVRLAGLAAALVGVWLLHNLIGVMGGFIIGELAALAVCMALVNRAGGHGLAHGFDRFALYLFASMAILAWPLALEHHSALGIAGAVVGSALAAGWCMWRERATLTQTVAIGRRIVGLR